VTAPGLKIRSARPDDLESLVGIEQVFPTDRLERRDFRHALASPTVDLLVAEGADGIAGYALLHRRKSSAIARLTSIAVRPGAKGRGLGRRLLEAAEAQALAKGCTRLRLEVRPSNKAAKRLYETHGYRRFAVAEDYYEDGAPAWRYEKALAASLP
jgi:[ribosomal protein S18]-alanine N-acetyltransferase